MAWFFLKCPKSRGTIYKLGQAKNSVSVMKYQHSLIKLFSLNAIHGLD